MILMLHVFTEFGYQLDVSVPSNLIYKPLLFESCRSNFC
jgi:hypothetical protein